MTLKEQIRAGIFILLAPFILVLWFNALLRVMFFVFKGM